MEKYRETVDAIKDAQHFINRERAQIFLLLESLELDIVRQLEHLKRPYTLGEVISGSRGIGSISDRAEKLARKMGRLDAFLDLAYEQAGELRDAIYDGAEGAPAIEGVEGES